MEPQTEPPPPYPRVLRACRLILLLPPAEAFNRCPAQVSSSGESRKVPSAFAPQDEQTSSSLENQYSQLPNWQGLSHFVALIGTSSGPTWRVIWIPGRQDHTHTHTHAHAHAHTHAHTHRCCFSKMSKEVPGSISYSKVVLPPASVGSGTSLPQRERCWCSLHQRAPRDVQGSQPRARLLDSGLQQRMEPG